MVAIVKYAFKKFSVVVAEAKIQHPVLTREVLLNEPLIEQMDILHGKHSWELNNAATEVADNLVLGDHNLRDFIIRRLSCGVGHWSHGQ